MNFHEKERKKLLNSTNDGVRKESALYIYAELQDQAHNHEDPNSLLKTNLASFPSTGEENIN